jgi:hypothetical protein
MQWKRISRTSALLAIFFIAAVFIIPAAHWMKTKLDLSAERPDPITASPEETIAILSTVLEREQFSGLPPPPPVPGEYSPPTANQPLVLVDRSLCLGEKPDGVCGSVRTDSVLIPEFDAFASRKFRAELMLANRAAQKLDLRGIPNTTISSHEIIERIFDGSASGLDDAWSSFYRTFPHSAGFAVISNPVISIDGKQALIYVIHYCGPLCGSGTLHLLIRSGTSWRIEKKEVLWVS